MTKTLTITDAEQRLAVATATVDRLRARLLTDGPASVTAEELGQAALDAEHARLSVGHAVKAAEDTAAAERHEHLTLLKQQTLQQAGTPDEAEEAMHQIRQAVAYLISMCTTRTQLIAQSTAAMRRAGVPPINGERPSDEHAGLGWTQAGLGRSDSVTIDDRRIGDINAGMVIAVAVAAGTRDAGRNTRWLEPGLTVTTDRTAADDPGGWLKARY